MEIWKFSMEKYENKNMMHMVKKIFMSYPPPTLLNGKALIVLISRGPRIKIVLILYI